jgi:hypothetical protein
VAMGRGIQKEVGSSLKIKRGAVMVKYRISF